MKNIHPIYNIKVEPKPLFTSAANCPGLTRSLRVSAFDLRALSVVLQSPGYGANCSCVKQTGAL